MKRYYHIDTKETTEKLKALGWELIGAGTYNLVFRSPDGHSVFKVQKHPSLTADSPVRSVRVWNEIYAEEIKSGLFHPAKVETIAGVEGWVSNYIEGQQSTDEEIRNAVIDIYNYAGRIVIDATVKKNFITDDHGKVYCVDIGMALRLINTDIVTPDGRLRSKSIESLKIWRADDEAIAAYWSGHRTHKNTINTLKALVFIQIVAPCELDVSELRNDLEGLDILVQAYDLEYDNYWRNEFEDDSSPEGYTTKSDKSSNDENIESKGELTENKTNYKR